MFNVPFRKRDKVKMQEEILMFSNCTMVNGELFFVETQNGLLAKMNPDNGDVSYCTAMENFIVKEGNTICDIRTFGDKLYALETSGEGITIFDLEKSQCRYIPLQCAYRGWGNFVAFEQYDSYFYIFPKYENKIFIMDTINNKILQTADCFDRITEWQCACRGGNKVWLLAGGVNVMGCYDLTSGKAQTFELKEKVENCLDAVIVDGNIYILNGFGIIYSWNIYKQKLVKIEMLDAEYCNGKFVYGKLIYVGSKLIILPLLGNEIKILDIPTGNVESYHDYPNDFLYYDMGHLKGWSKYDGLCKDNDYYYCAMRRENYLLKIRKRDGALLWIKPNMPTKEERLKILNPLKEKKIKNAMAAGVRLFWETETDVGRFIEEVPRKQYLAKGTNIGEIIFEAVKRE